MNPASLTATPARVLTTRLAGAGTMLAKQLYGPATHLLPLVEQRLQAELQTHYESLAPILRHGVQLGGKRLRPALLLLAGIAVDPQKVGDNHVTLGVVLEMVHTATLIHDDVLDEADTRRRVQTINAVWGDHVSILLGDYLFSQAFRLSATLDSTAACRWIGEASRKVCEGELRQVLARDHVELDEASYIEMIRGKTAELCSVACRLGASQADAAPEIVAKLADYGTALGIAFQIADDYLDLWGDSDTVGKTLGTDLQQGKWTLPILRLLQTATESDLIQIRAILAAPSEHRFDQLMPMIEASDARDYTRQIAESFRDQACDSIASLVNSPAKRALIDLATFSISRTS